MDISNRKKYCNDMKNVRQWLHSTKTRCDSLKSHMEYMKMLYHDIPKIQDTKKTYGSQKWHSSKTKYYNDNDNTTIAKQINCNNTLEEYSDIQCTFVQENGPVLVPVSSEINIQHKEDAKVKNLNKENEMEIELSSIMSQAYNLDENTHSQTKLSSSVHKEDTAECEEHKDNWQHSYQKHLAEYSTELVENMVHSKHSFEQLTLDNEKNCMLHELSSVRDNIKLNNSDNIKDGSIDKSKICTRSEKKEKAVSSSLASKKGSLCKLDDMVSLKFKKRRRKVHCSNSRSTVTTRDTNFVGRRDIKKRKQKNTVNNRHTFKPQQTSNEVVEIYHNAAAKSGSTSAIPSKHSKLDHHTNYINVLTSSAVNKHKNLNVKPKCEENDFQQTQDINTDHKKDYSHVEYSCKQKTDPRSTNDNDLNYNLEVSPTPLCAVKKCESHQCQRAIIQASYCDPIITHNYEMPTLASKLKRANRTYFSRFSFRNIPFVVGTSVTPSHNLGLNIQQVLSIMKTRQSPANGITPLLIRKISRGMKPASILMEQMSDQQSKLSYMNSQLNNTHVKDANLFINNGEHSVEDKNVYLNYDRKADTRSENQLNMLNTAQMLPAMDNKMLKLFASQQNVKTELETTNESIYDKRLCTTSTINHAQDPKGIRDVLVNLHDQFEEMNTKYEKLQSKAKKGNDKDLEEEILNLEKELSIKEDEINAVVNLYKEVLALKQQMRLLQEKKSYVCISTEIPLGSNKVYSTVPFTSNKSYTSGFQQKFQQRRGNNNITAREPTSLRLTGLLRQIQTFQKQLKLMSW